MNNNEFYESLIGEEARMASSFVTPFDFFGKRIINTQ